MNVPWFPPSSSFSRSADQPNIGLLETGPCDNGTRRCVERRREEMGGDLSEEELRIDTSEMISSSSNLLLLRAFFVANTFCRHMNCRRTFAILFSSFGYSGLGRGDACPFEGQHSRARPAICPSEKSIRHSRTGG